MSYDDDKRELLKLKQGLIEESETIKEEPNAADKAHYEVKGFKNKVANFFYHYKIHVILISFFTALTVFLVYTTVTKERGDARVLLFSDDPEVAASFYYKSYDIERALEQYTPNYDNNGYVHVELFYMNMDAERDANYYMADQAKLYGELRSAVAYMFIANRQQLSDVLGNQSESKGFEDLSALYPDDPNIVDKYYYHIKGTAFADAAMYLESCPDDLYIAIRSKTFTGIKEYDGEMAENHDKAMEILDNIVKDNKVNPIVTEQSEK